MARYTIADLEKQLALMTANRKADDMIVGSTIHEAARESAKRNKARAEAMKLQKELQDKETKASPEHRQVRPEGGKKPPKRSEQKKHEHPTQKAPGKPTEEPKDRENKTPEHRQVRPEQKTTKPEDGKKISTASLKEAAVKAAESGGRVVRRVVEGGREAARNVYNKGRETDEKRNALIPRGLRAVERHIDKGRAYPVRLDTSDLVIPEISSEQAEAATKQYESVLKLWRKAIDKKTRDAARKHRLSMLR